MLNFFAAPGVYGDGLLGIVSLILSRCFRSSRLNLVRKMGLDGVHAA